jgi:hypothetical protein
MELVTIVIGTKAPADSAAMRWRKSYTSFKEKKS